ncbi:SOS response-associated peptidase family protein [Dokdonia sp.]|uniref:SOS response-associated peptidase n=1 Tax=Dokdonia sp. TaxID=2024995 RepID=UPI003262E23E
MSLSKKEHQLSDFHTQTDLFVDPPLVYEPTFHNNGFNHENVFIIPQENANKIVPARWGLIPYEELISGDGKPIKFDNLNTRDDKVFTFKSWSDSIFKNRCLILADGFFEPHRRGEQSYPVYCYLEGHKLFAFAGIYTENEDELYTASIITVKGNNQFQEIHNNKLNYKKKLDARMPLVLDDPFHWLRNDLDKNAITELMMFGSIKEDFKAHTVTRELYAQGKSFTYNPKAIEPIIYSDLFGEIEF